MTSSFCVKPSILSLSSKKFHSVSFFGKKEGKVQKKSRKRRCYPVFCGFLILFRVSVAYAFTPLYSSETVSFLRPLARRAANTLRPLAVAILSRKPCLFFLFLLDLFFLFLLEGWNVLFIAVSCFTLLFSRIRAAKIGTFFK